MSRLIPVYTHEQRSIIGVCVVCSFLPAIAVGLRLWAKRVAHRSLDWSDYWVITALIALFGSWLATIFMVLLGGYGLPPEEVSRTYGAQTITSFHKAGYACLLQGVAAAYLCKMSIIVLYYRVFTTPNTRKPVRIVGIFTILCGIATFVGFLTYIPFEKLFNPDLLPLTSDEEWRKDSFELFTGCATCLTDVMLLCVPLWRLSILQIDRRRKVWLMVAFMFGFTTCFVAIVRTLSTYIDFPTSDPIQILFKGLEPTVGIVSACLPLMHPLISRTARSGRFARRAESGTPDLMKPGLPVVHVRRPSQSRRTDASDADLDVEMGGAWYSKDREASKCFCSPLR